MAQALAASGVAPGRLILEITESVMLDAEDRLESDLMTLREMGCIISLDDFGRGYSSLAYLARLPVDILKMDREFVAHIETDPRGAALVASVIELGRTLAMDVVAEGVETPGQLGIPHRDGLPVRPGLPAEPAGAGRTRRRRAWSTRFDPAVLDAVAGRRATCPTSRATPSTLAGQPWLTGSPRRGAQWPRAPRLPAVLPTVLVVA